MESSVKYGQTDPEDFDRAFGQHSNLRECCIEYRANVLNGRGFAPCKRCQLQGGLEAFVERLHRCSADNSECQPFLQYIHERCMAEERKSLDSPDPFTEAWHYRNNFTDAQMAEQMAVFVEYGYVVEKTEEATENDPTNIQYHIFKPKEGKLLQFRPR